MLTETIDGICNGKAAKCATCCAREEQPAPASAIKKGKAISKETTPLKRGKDTFEINETVEEPTNTHTPPKRGKKELPEETTAAVAVTPIITPLKRGKTLKAGET